MISHSIAHHLTRSKPLLIINWKMNDHYFKSSLSYHLLINLAKVCSFIVFLCTGSTSDSKYVNAMSKHMQIHFNVD